MEASKTIREPARDVEVFREADVVVVGGGPAGFGAAVTAARNGAKTVLVERYGHLGGMATGGIVLELPQVFADVEPWYMPGLNQEIIDRADALGGCLQPSKEETGSRDEKVVSYWQKRTGRNVRDGSVTWSAYSDPEILKCVMNSIVEEAGVKLYLHSWACRAVVEEGAVRGVIFESKSGRLAILGKVVVDTTGDGDIFASAGAEFDASMDPELRSSQLALVFRLGNVDFARYNEFRQAEPEKHRELVRRAEGTWGEELRSVFRPSMANYCMLPLPTPQEDVIWINNWIKGVSATNVEDLTWVEVNIRKAMLLWHSYAKQHLPGFERSFILDTASQLGTRGSRRLAGEYTVTRENAGTVQDDTIAVFRRRGPSDGQGKTYVPYRSLVPRRMEGLLVAGRCFSSDPVSNNMLNLIPHCIAMGEAAGAAAALAAKQGVNPRQVDYRLVQAYLTKQGFTLPTPALA